MPRRSTEHLLKLISRMTPTEKRNFKVAVSHSNPGVEVLFLSLFDVIDKSKVYNEELILKKIPAIRKGQLSNIKSNLYKQILGSLRQQKRHSYISIQIREQIDFAVILHAKGLYNAAFDILERAKKMAYDSDRQHSVLVILELEKQIESLYITGSMYHKAKELKSQTKEAVRLVSISHKLSNLSLSLYGMYLQYGYVKDERDFDFVTDYFKHNLPELDINTLDFYSKLYYYQSHVWYNNMIQDFPNNFKYAQRWVDLFHSEPQWQDRELTLYLKGLHNLLNPLFMAQRYDKFLPVYQELLVLGKNSAKRMNRDQLSTFKLIEYTHGINRYYLTGDFVQGVAYVKEIEKAIEANTFDWDLNRIILFNYKIASIYFCIGDLDHAIGLLNKITNQVYPEFREDIQAFARVLNLIAHFELGNTLLVNHQIKSTFRYLSKIKQLDKVLTEILSFVRRIPKIEEVDLKQELIHLKKDLEKIEQDQFERRAFLYLDIISWLESKIENIPVGDVIRRKIKERE
ncbi:MAG: tetratricopeptide (TPR) repeat protein [Saprospiraceae bacterium]|jgi:tetratricopeptide (TPR) repeat protein